MKRPTIAVIDDNEDDLMLMERSLEKSYLYPIVHSYQASQDFDKDFKEGRVRPSFVLCDYNLTSENAVEVAKRLRGETGYRGPFFITSGVAELLTRARAETSHQYNLNVTGHITKDDVMDVETLNNFFEGATLNEFVQTPYKIAIAGLGDLGIQIASQSLRLLSRHTPLINQLYLWSSEKKAIEYARKIIGEPGWTRVEHCSTLEELAHKGSDIFVIARGPRGFDPENIKSRKDADRAMMTGSCSKMDECYRALYNKGYNGLIFPISNRVGPHCLRGLEWNDEWGHNIVAPSPDGDRVAAVVFRKIKEDPETEQHLLDDTFQLKVEVFGEHGDEQLYLGSAYVQSGAEIFPLSTINPKYGDAEYRMKMEQEIVRETHSLGRETQIARKLTGSSPQDAANAVTEFIYEVITNNKPSSAVQSLVSGEALGYNNEMPSFLLQRVVYNLHKGGIFPDLTPGLKGIANAPERLKVGLREQVRYQYELKDKYYPPISEVRGF